MNNSKFYTVLEIITDAVFLGGWALLIVGHCF